jgi:hypothetical protein
MRHTAVLIGFLLALAGFNSQSTAAQIESIRITIDNYDSSKVVPGETVDVTFTLYKPAGIELKGKLYTACLYFEDQKVVFVHKWYTEAPETALDISWGMEENQGSFTLPLILRDDAPIGKSVRVSAAVRVDCDYNLIDGNTIKIAIENENFVREITRVRQFESYQYYYIFIAPGMVMFVCISPWGTEFIAVGYDAATIRAPAEDTLTTLIVGVAVVIVLVAIVAIVVKKRAGEALPEVLEMPRD